MYLLPFQVTAAGELKCSGAWVFLKGEGIFIIDLELFLIF